jgi:tetratricopeptide (TPR) repeat protein
VLAIDEKNSEAWNNLGSIFEITGQPEDAITAYQKSLALNPYQEEANINLAQIEYGKYRINPDSKKKEELIRRLHFVLSMNPQKTRAQHLLHELTK